MFRSFNKLLTNTLLFSGTLFLLAGCQPGPSQEKNAGNLTIGVHTDPHPAKLGDNHFRIFVNDTDGKLTDADVHLRMFMDGMPMSTDNTLIPAAHTKNGVYVGVGDFSMGGDWLVEVTVTPPGGRTVGVRFPFTIEWTLE